MWKLSLLPSRSQVVFPSSFLSLSLSFFYATHDVVRKPEARKNRDNRRNCGKSTRTQWYRRIREIRDERIAPYETEHASLSLVVVRSMYRLVRIRLDSQERFVALELSDTVHLIKKRHALKNTPRDFFVTKDFYLAKRIELIKIVFYKNDTYIYSWTKLTHNFFFTFSLKADI